MKRQKIEIKASLKAEDYKVGQLVKGTAFITEIKDIETKFGDKTLITFDDKDSVFMNMQSNNNLIEKYGDDDKAWIGKAVKIECSDDNAFNKPSLVVIPIA